MKRTKIWFEIIAGLAFAGMLIMDWKYTLCLLIYVSWVKRSDYNILH